MTKQPLTLYLAAPRGFCAGVDRAIKIVEMALDKWGAPVFVRRTSRPARGPRPPTLFSIEDRSLHRTIRILSYTRTRPTCGGEGVGWGFSRYEAIYGANPAISAISSSQPSSPLK